MDFAGYAPRGSSGTIYKVTIEGCITGKRDKGRQNRTWTDDLKDWTNLKTFFTLKRTAEDKEK